MNSTRQLMLGIAFMILGITGFIISSFKMAHDPCWILTCFISIITTVNGILLIDNLQGENYK